MGLSFPQDCFGRVLHITSFHRESMGHLEVGIQYYKVSIFAYFVNQQKIGSLHSPGHSIRNQPWLEQASGTLNQCNSSVNLQFSLSPLKHVKSQCWAFPKLKNLNEKKEILEFYSRTHDGSMCDIL